MATRGCYHGNKRVLLRELTKEFLVRVCLRVVVSDIRVVLFLFNIPSRSDISNGIPYWGVPRLKQVLPWEGTTNQNTLFRSRDWLSANQRAVFPYWSVPRLEVAKFKHSTQHIVDFRQKITCISITVFKFILLCKLLAESSGLFCKLSVPLQLFNAV